MVSNNLVGMRMLDMLEEEYGGKVRMGEWRWCMRRGWTEGEGWRRGGGEEGKGRGGEEERRA